MSEEEQEKEEEVVFEEENNETPTSGFGGSASDKKSKDKLKKCQEEKQEYLDGWQRSKADFVNFKKRSEEDKKNVANFILEDFVSELLPALDSFDMAFKNEEAWNEAPEVWRKGIEYIYQQIMSALESRGITQNNPLNESFDPNKHNSVGVIETSEKDNEGKILEVILKGYSVGDKIIRVSNVKVGELDK